MEDWLANAPSNEGYMQLQRFARAFNFAHPFTNRERNNSSKMVAALLRSFRTRGMCLTDMLLTFVWAKPESPRPPLLDRLRPLDLAAHFETSGWALGGLEPDEWNFPIARLLWERGLLDAVQDAIAQAGHKRKRAHLLVGQQSRATLRPRAAPPPGPPAAALPLTLPPLPPLEADAGHPGP